MDNLVSTLQRPTKRVKGSNEKNSAQNKPILRFIDSEADIFDHSMQGQRRPIERQYNNVGKEIFEQDSGELFALLYCFAYSDTFKELLEDDEFQECMAGPKSESLLNLIYQPLNLAFWQAKTPQETMKRIEAVLLRFKTFLSDYQGYSITDIYLHQLRQGLLAFCELTGDQEEPQFGGLYRYLRPVSGLTRYKTIFYLRPELRYESREFSLYLDSRTMYKVCLHSHMGFCGLTLDTLLQTLKYKLDNFKDYFVFDGRSKRELSLGTTLATLDPSTPLLLSELVTNLSDDTHATTVRLCMKEDPSLFFLISFEGSVITPSLLFEMKTQVQRMLGKDQFDLSLIPISSGDKENRISSQYCSSEEDAVARVVAQMIGTHMFADLGFRGGSKGEHKTLSVTKIEQWPSPGEIVEDFYKQKSNNLETSEHSAQVIIVQYPSGIGLPVEALCKDIRSTWLDSSNFVYYRLQGIVAEIYEMGNLAWIPLVPRDTGQWYSPYHNYSLPSLADLEQAITLVYERTYESLY